MMRDKTNSSIATIFLAIFAPNSDRNAALVSFQRMACVCDHLKEVARSAASLMESEMLADTSPAPPPETTPSPPLPSPPPLAAAVVSIEGVSGGGEASEKDEEKAMGEGNGAVEEPNMHKMQEEEGAPL